MKVTLADEAIAELRALPLGEHNAMINAIAKLQAFGEQLMFPHSSQVKGQAKGTSLRELRPRRGASPWRAFYRRVGPDVVVFAIGPEAESDPRGFQRAVAAALDRFEAFTHR